LRRLPSPPPFPYTTLFRSVEGLKDGSNQLVAKAGGKEATLTVVNHSVNGTLFAGPQQEPFICENESHGLASPNDNSCAAPTTVRSEEHTSELQSLTNLACP